MMEMFLYIDVDSFVHRLYPRTKLALMLLSFALALSIKSFPFLTGLLAAVLLYGAAGGVLGNLRRIRVLLLMIALFSVVIWTLAYLSVHGVVYGAMVAVKTDLMIISGMVFLSATKIEEIAEGLVRLRPYRRVRLLHRDPFGFYDNLTSYTVIRAQKSRGLDSTRGSLLQHQRHVPLVAPSLVSVMRGTNVFLWRDPRVLATAGRTTAGVAMKRTTG